MKNKNEVYTDAEEEAKNTDNVSDIDGLVRSWRKEVDRREQAINMTIRHFMSKSDVPLHVFQQHLESIYNFLETGKTKNKV